MQKSTSSPELTEEMLKALDELGRPMEKDHMCDRCLNRMSLSMGYIGGLRVVLYECGSCGHMDIREFIG